MNPTQFRLLTLGVPTLTLALLLGCSPEPQAPQSATYQTMVLQPQDRTQRQKFTAQLKGQQVVEVRPQVSGLITNICINEGQKVRKGQTLFVIDQVPYKAAMAQATANVKSAQAALATAKLNLESTQMLRQNDVVQDYDLLSAQNQLADAEASLAQAQALEVSARNNLSYTEVKSPVDGVAGMIAYRVGALVSSSISEPLVTVSDDSQIYAYFSLPEAQITDLLEQYGSLENFVSSQTNVELRLSNGKPYDLKGSISAVSGIVSSSTGSVTIRADFPNPKRLLRDGSSATVVLPSTLSQVLIIPQGATYELQNMRFAFKVVDGKAQSVPVKIFRLNNGTEFVVQEGLLPNDVIIAEGAGLVKEGASVTIGKE